MAIAFGGRLPDAEYLGRQVQRVKLIVLFLSMEQVYRLPDSRLIRILISESVFYLVLSVKG